MAYRDDEVGQLRSQLKDISERLGKIEEHYSKRGFDKTFGRKVLEGLWTGTTWPFRTTWSIVSNPGFWIATLVLGLIVGGGWLLRENWIREAAEAEAVAQHNAEAEQERRLAAQAEREAAQQAEEAAAAEEARIEQAAREEVYQALVRQCQSFCRTHGYEFREDRRGDLCFCTRGNSEDTAFIINVETSEQWTVRGERR